MEQRLHEWPKSTQANSTSTNTSTSSTHLAQQQHHNSYHTSNTIGAQHQHQHQHQVTLESFVGSAEIEAVAAEKTISSLEIQVEEQRQLRLQDARQIEAKAAKIKEWVHTKLRDLEEQNQVLREQNIKCNQQLELLRNHIANQQANRHSGICVPARNSLSFDVPDFPDSADTTRRRSECFETNEILSRPLISASYPHHQHRRNLSMEPQELERNLTAAVDSLTLVSLSSISAKSDRSLHDSSDTDTAHDYAEIYTPSSETLPAWLRNASAMPTSGPDSSTTTLMSEPCAARPPTPPLHRFPSWEAKIYQVANDGLAVNSRERDIAFGSFKHHEMHAAPVYSGGNSATLPNCRLQVNTANTSSTLNTSNSSAMAIAAGTPPLPMRNQKTAAVFTTTSTTTNTTSTTVGAATSDGFCDISVPVYATVKGRASQIRSMPFTGDSSDDSSDGEDHAVMLTHNSHNSSSTTENTESSTASGSASSPSKSLKTSSSLSPAKRSGSDSPNNAKACGLSDDYALPPDAIYETSNVDASVPALLMRQSYVESPFKKTESLEKMGHLAKLGGKLKTWRKRWFVLKNGTLNYYNNQHDTSCPQGQIMLDEACRITRADGAATFEIDTGKKVYYLTADSGSAMDDWIRLLQNVQRRNATKLLLSREDRKPTVQGWATKVKNGHAKRCWCVLLDKMFLYFKVPTDMNPLGQINMRDARVEEVEHVSDSDSEERDDPSQDQARLTVAIYPTLQGPTYLILDSKQDRDNWIYHLTVVSGGGPSAGTQYEQIVQRLMEVDGNPNDVLWRHQILLHTKDAITSPLSTIHSEGMHVEATKLFKSIQLFMSVAINQPGIDYHVVLAQNALQHCLDIVELQTEMICILIKQTSRHTNQKTSVGVQVNKKLSKQTRAPTSVSSINDCKSNPPAYGFVQGWQLLALAISLFVPKSSRLLWYLKLHLSRNVDTKTDTGKYAAYCERALERTLKNGGRETKPSRMEVLSILLKNPYHHSLPHAIPVHMMNGTYQVVSFDGSTTIEEFQSTLSQEIGTRDATNGFCLFSDDPIEKDIEHYLYPNAKVCDVISKWETALREKGSGKFENSRVIQLTYKNRLYWRNMIKFETDKERLLLCYQTNAQIVQGRFPLSRELALELASLMAQIDMGDYSHEKSRCGNAAQNAGLRALDKFYPYRYRDALATEQLKDVQEQLIAKWILLSGRSTIDCVRIYLTCCRKWSYFGASLFQAKPCHNAVPMAVAWLAIAEDALHVLELSSMVPIARYTYTSVITFGGCQDDFMLVISNGDPLVPCSQHEEKLLFAMNKPKILEVTLLIADYMNALGHAVPGTPQMNSLTRNGSHRSLRATQRPGPANLGTAAVYCGLNTLTGYSTNATNTAHNTLNSNTTHTLNSMHSHTLNSSHHSSHGGGVSVGLVNIGGGSHPGTLNYMHMQGFQQHQHQHQHHHHQEHLQTHSHLQPHPHAHAHQQQQQQQHHQPDILKTTPDHQRIK